MTEPREERIVKNEALFRDVNERVLQAIAGREADRECVVCVVNPLHRSWHEVADEAKTRAGELCDLGVESIDEHCELRACTLRF